MEFLTLQKMIFKISKCKTNREFSFKLNKSESYISNQLNSKNNISIELGIETMKSLGITNDRIIEVIKLYLKTNFGVFDEYLIEQNHENKEISNVNLFTNYEKIISNNHIKIKELNSKIHNLKAVAKKQEKEILELKKMNYQQEHKSEFKDNYHKNKLFKEVEIELTVNNHKDFIKNLKHKERQNQNLIDFKLKHYYVIIDKLIKKIISQEKFEYNKYLGCDYFEFKNHVEISFQENMNWDNYGLWVIRLINSPNEISKIKNYVYFENLQPIWLIKEENKNL